MSIKTIISIAFIPFISLIGGSFQKEILTTVYSKYLTSYDDCVHFSNSRHSFAFLLVKYNITSAKQIYFGSGLSGRDCAIRVRDTGYGKKHIIPLSNDALSYKATWHLWDHFPPWTVEYLAYALPPHFNAKLYEANFRYIIVGFQSGPESYTINNIRILNRWSDQLMSSSKVAVGLQLDALAIKNSTTDLRSFHAYNDNTQVIIKTKYMDHRLRNLVTQKLANQSNVIWYCIRPNCYKDE